MNIIPKRTKLYSIFHFKCPQCHEGDVFTTNNPYNLKRLFELKKKCDVCGHVYESEPGFFYGAMYVSYGYTVAIGMALYGLMELIYDPPVAHILIALILILLLGSPYIFRISRITWMNLFVKYDPEKKHSKFS